MTVEASTERVSLSDAARILDVGLSHVYRLVDRGELRPMRDPLHRKGARVWLRRADVVALRERAGRWIGPDGQPIEPTS